MSTPITTIHKAAEDTTVDAASNLESAAESSVEETTAAEASSLAEEANDASEEAPAPKGKKTGSSLLALVLAGLLLGSVAINLKQSREVSNLESRSGEYQQALAAAVDRIDSESARADGAEDALGRVDSAVDVVNERVLGLQEALEQLREATVR